ncbi:phage gp6-like head-tail connector protein [Kitasatospora sp. NPDC004614]|uniref:phage gp6-like head-tail connector protein n=1 Tax=unclassified Kitasatospora TaxID=2633591 RepID=UPI003681B3A9
MAVTDYVTLADIKEALKIENSDATRDNLLGKAIRAASRGIDRACGRRFYRDDNATPRTYSLHSRVTYDEWGALLVVDDLSTTEGLIVETGTGGAWTATTRYDTFPENAGADGWAITGLRQPYGYWGFGPTSRVRVTARWGWPAVPDDVAQAALTQAMRLFRRKDSPEGVTGSAEWGVVRLSRRDPDVWNLIEPYVLSGFG